MMSDEAEKDENNIAAATGNLNLSGTVKEPPKYTMNNKERGVAIIINNTFKGPGRELERKGTGADENQMHNLFAHLGFEQIILKNNLSVSVMEKELEEVASKDFKDKDCLVCVILSYGDEGYVIGEHRKDKVAVEDLVKKFKGANCQSLAGKPKLFFIQTCPLRRLTDHDGKEGDVAVEERWIPVEADCLLVHSNIPGSDVWNEDSKKPSLFIEKLVEAVRKYRSLDILSVLTRMNKEVSRAFHDKNIKDRKLPYVSSTLTKDLFL